MTMLDWADGGIGTLAAAFVVLVLFLGIREAIFWVRRKDWFGYALVGIFLFVAVSAHMKSKNAEWSLFGIYEEAKMGFEKSLNGQ